MIEEAQIMAKEIKMPPEWYRKNYWPILDQEYRTLDSANI